MAGAIQCGAGISHIIHVIFAFYYHKGTGLSLIFH